jgi:hypothetical protein
MAINFTTNDRPDKGVQEKLQLEETPLKIIPFPKTGEEPNQNFQELLATERYAQVVEKIKRYTNLNTTIVGKQGLNQYMGEMMDSVYKIVELEAPYRTQLEELGINLVKKEMGIPEGVVQFDAKIIGFDNVETNDFNMEKPEAPQNPVNIEQEEISDESEIFKLECAKRRCINAIIQGASKKGHYMYHYVEQEVNDIVGDNSIIGLYGKMMSVNDALYWHLPDNSLEMMASEGSIAGKEEVDRQTDPPTIKVRALNFPALIHELIKGLLELFSHQGEPEDKDLFIKVMQQEDLLHKEMWDLRLGPSMWDRIRNQFPEEILVDETLIEHQNYLITEIFKLPAKTFLIFIKEVLTGSEKGKKYMAKLMNNVYENISENEILLGDSSEDLFDDNDDDGGELVK